MRFLLFISLFISAPSSEGADPLEDVFSKAAADLSGGDLAAAEQGFRSVLKARPNHIGALGNLGVIYSRSGRTHDAVAVYGRALKLAPNDPGLLLNLGLAHLKNENHLAAKPIFVRLLQRNPSDIRLQELLATAQVYTGESEKALPTLAQLPTTSNVLFLTGLAHLKLGHRDQARRILDGSFPATISAAQASFLRGKAYYDATLFDDSIREYRQARAFDAKLPGLSLELARALISVRDNEAAESELRGILRQQPSDADAGYLLGAMLVQQAREPEAIKWLELARAARPDGWGAYYYLGRAKLQRNDAPSALPLLEKAAELNPEESAVFYQLSRAYKALGRNAEARKAALRVSELKRQTGIVP